MILPPSRKREKMGFAKVGAKKEIPTKENAFRRPKKNSPFPTL